MAKVKHPEGFIKSTLTNGKVWIAPFVVDDESIKTKKVLEDYIEACWADGADQIMLYEVNPTPVIVKRMVSYEFQDE